MALALAKKRAEIAEEHSIEIGKEHGDTTLEHGNDKL
eukprot:CAMPEP_0171831190 /NCGR_PEP_ID=MMETSP0992-20121227/8645_1 /TAXON_ID=483369 /ORGANISM="non described non described, Strain CCMP2098" /LENGTH=36 /DNA_ID= /DNA_START= /DNA_END= /DNA_ORIENTATION=